MKKWKFLNKGLKSASGDCKWKIGEWKTYKGELSMCNSGFHCSKGIYQAFSYVQGEILAEVEVKGKHLADNDKEVWSEMRIVKAWKWQKKDSVALAVFAAELVLPIFEKKHQEDKRPRKAIEAAIKWLKDPTDKNRAAAGAAAGAAWAAARATRDAAARDAAWAAAGAAAGAAWAAAGAAWAAARAAGDAGAAARDAAWAARAAARDAAEAAAWAARDAGAALIKKIAKWMDQRLLELEEIKK